MGVRAPSEAWWGGEVALSIVPTPSPQSPSLNPPNLCSAFPSRLHLHLHLAAGPWGWTPSQVGWAAPVRGAVVVAAANLGVNPLAGYSITFWTELIGAPGTWASLVVVAPQGQQSFKPGLWFSPSGRLHIEVPSTMYSSVLSGAYNQRMLVGACFTPNGVVMRFRGVGGFSLTETASGNSQAFPSGAVVYVSDPW
jgi:hypothetical protein